MGKSTDNPSSSLRRESCKRQRGEPRKRLKHPPTMFLLVLPTLDFLHHWLQTWKDDKKPALCSLDLLEMRGLFLRSRPRGGRDGAGLEGLAGRGGGGACSLRRALGRLRRRGRSRAVSAWKHTLCFTSGCWQQVSRYTEDWTHLAWAEWSEHGGTQRERKVPFLEKTFLKIHWIFWRLMHCYINSS